MYKKNKLKETVFEQISAYPTPISKIAETLGKDFSTIQKQILYLLVEKRIKEDIISGVKMYVLPEETELEAIP